ncbi:MAG TPA: hypothetical protein VFQ40_09175 [Actinomycetota bacterium]|nr:hypothetical protein [Actinomycetota bacterium]
MGAPFVAAALTVVAMALVAGAHDTDLTDPDDARGKLDIRKVRLAHEDHPPMWTVVTFSRWGNFEMWDRGYVEVLLDTRHTEEAEYYLLVRTDRSKLEGSLWRLHPFGPDTYLGTVGVKRLSLRSVSVQVALRRLEFGERRDSYRWWIHTVVTSEVCPRTCHDRAPNRGAVEQWRPGRSPSPSVSTTTTPPPSP